MTSILTSHNVNNIEYYRNNVLNKMLFVDTSSEKDIPMFVIDIKENFFPHTSTSTPMLETYTIKIYNLKDNSISSYGDIKRHWFDLIVLASTKENLGTYITMSTIDPNYFSPSFENYYAIMVL